MQTAQATSKYHRQISLGSTTGWYIQIFFLVFEDEMQKKFNCCCPTGSANTKGDTQNQSQKGLCWNWP